MVIRFRPFALAAATCACIGASGVGEGCIVVPPPDLAPAPVRPPRILHDSVFPPADVPFGVWPPDNIFIVPIEMEDPDPNVNPRYQVFVGPPQTELLNMPPAPRPVDGGVLLSFPIEPQNIDLGVCHTIQAVVSDPGAPGADSVTWVYGGSGAPYGCPIHGAFQDGQFSPPNDATTDSLPIPPETGGGS